MSPLPPLRSDGVFPGEDWELGRQLTGDPDALRALLDPVFSGDATDELGQSLALVAVQGGRIVAERYAPSVGPDTTFISWSTAKSFTQAALGVLALDGRFDPDVAFDAPEWDGDDPRGAITGADLLRMRSGLRFVEDYVDDSVSDCLEMLWGSGADDMAGYAAALPLEHAIGSEFNYSSGATNILARRLSAECGPGPDGAGRFLRERIFEPLGMRTAEPKFDAAGTWVGSSYLYATARDFARFGLLYLRDGVWDGQRLVPEGWVDRARAPHSVDPDDGWLYGEHWWARGDDLGTFWAHGYEGQMIGVVPALDLVLVRLGKTPSELRPHLERFWHDVVDTFREPA